MIFLRNGEDGPLEVVDEWTDLEIVMNYGDYLVFEEYTEEIYVIREKEFEKKYKPYGGKNEG